MRQAAAAQTVLALLLAFFLAPFQHVHTDSDHPDHAFAGEVHAHLFFVHTHAPARPVDGTGIDDDDDDDHAHVRSVDSVTPVLPHHTPLLLLSPASPALPVPTPFHERVKTVEATANSPPPLNQSSPRGPPL